MNRLQISNFVFQISLAVFLWPYIYADDARPFRTTLELNHNVPDPQSAYSTMTVHRSDGPKDVSSYSKQEQHQYADQLSPTPLQHQTMLPQEALTFITKHEYQTTNSNHQPGSIQYQQPMVNSRRQQSDVHYHKKKYIPDMNYVYKAAGKEKFYAEDGSNEYRPHFHTEESSAEYRPHKIDIPFPAKDDSMEYMNKKMNYEKSYKKYKFAYSSNRGENAFHAPDYEMHAGAASNDQNYPKYVQPTRLSSDKTDFYGAKSSSWKQLGPNIEISTSAEHPVYAKRDSSSAIAALPKNVNKKRKTNPKNVRTGYMTQQHALYIANNLANLGHLRPKGVFNHNDVLKQSDKFELSDAMFQELEEAKKNNDLQLRIKQESAKYHPEYNALQYYQPNPLVNALPVENHSYGKYYQPYQQVNSLSKGFIRNIEIETSPSGAKRMIPALIIPLSSEQLNHEVGLYVNSPEVLNPGVKIPNTRYAPSELYNTILPVENYQYQLMAAPYGFRTAEENYNPYVNYQQQNLYRLPYNLNSVSSTPTSVDAKAPKRKPSVKGQSQANRLSQPHPSENAKVDLKKDVYMFEEGKDDKHFSASESNNYFTTASNVKDKDQKMVEKIETKENSVSVS